MKEILKQRSSEMLLFFSLVIICIYGWLNINDLNIIYIALIELLATVILALLNQKFIKGRLPFCIKNDSKFLIAYFIFISIVAILLKHSFLDIIIIALDICLFYTVIADMFYHEKYISLIVFGILCAFIKVRLFALYMSVGLLGISLLRFIDITAIYRKKNVAIIFLTEIVMGLLVIYDFRFLVFALLFLVFACKKMDIKSLIKMTCIPLLIIVVLCCVLNFSGKGLLTVSSDSSLLCIAMISSLIIGIINTLLKKEKYTSLELVLIVFLIGSISLQKYNIFQIAALIPISILLGKCLNELPEIIKSTIKISDKHVIGRKDCLKVSAVIPNFNYEKYIEERIDSILYQTYPVEELIVLDDCSTDNSIEVIKKKLEMVKKDYPELKVKFIPNKKNSGNVFKQWKKCFEESTGDYLWICEADDSASPYFLENVMSFFEKDSDVILAHSESLTIDENNLLLMPNLREWVDIYKTDKWERSFVEDGKQFNKNYLAINNTIANVSGAVFQKKKGVPFEEFLKTAESFKLAGDWYFYENILDYGKIAYSRKSLNYHRMHSSSVTLTTKREKEYQEIRRIQDDIINRYNDIPLEVKNRIDTRNQKFRYNYGFSDEELRINDISWDKLNKKMNQQIMLSIIIPVYNTAKYLRKCLESVLEELPPRTEIIIINDGSPDNSEEIIKDFQNNYKEVIKYYKKENGGLSSAKNYGLKKASGKYIGFLDSDDYVKTNMFSCMLKKALLEDLDLVYCDVELVFEDGSHRFTSTTNSDQSDALMRCLDTPLMPASWNKIVKKKIIQDLNYPLGLNNEDIAVSPILFARSKKVDTIPSPFYKYYQRSGSIQNSGFSNKRFVAFKTAKICFERANKFEKDIQDKIKGAVYTHQLFSILFFLIAEEKNRKKRLNFIKTFQKEINMFSDYQSNQYLLHYLKINNRLKIIDLLQNSDEKRIDLYIKTGL